MDSGVRPTFERKSSSSSFGRIIIILILLCASSSSGASIDRSHHHHHHHHDDDDHDRGRGTAATDTITAARDDDAQDDFLLLLAPPTPPEQQRSLLQHQQIRDEPQQQQPLEEEGKGNVDIRVRELQSSQYSANEASHHYFCGRGFADASRSCEHPCPSGSWEDCPTGMLCYYDTPCDSSTWTFPTPNPTTPQPTPKPTRDVTLWAPPTAAPYAEDDPKLRMYCGRGWEDASKACGRWCPDGDDTQCPYGQQCYTETNCKKTFPTGIPGLYTPPTPAPWAEDDPRLSFFCGKSWGDAGTKCGTWCPDADDSKCPRGESCYGGTTCKYTPSPTLAPTTESPTLDPTPFPTAPTQSPTPAPLGRLPDAAENHMFCGNDWQQASNSCSLETYCGENGAADCKIGYCWHRVTCDVREYISHEIGGDLGRPSHQQIAQSLGLTYPSDDPSDHFFCGATLERASERCSRPCPNGSRESCGHAEYCFENTPCDARVMHGYGDTDAPTVRPTNNPVLYDVEENYMFCGTSWVHANNCMMRWCGDGSECPGGQSCYADTECNILDREPLPPSLSPTLPPVTYDDDSNSYFCGASYPQAVSQCSVETYCRTGQHDECPGPSNYCWPGVACNVQDMIEPTPPRTPSPTILSPPPTISPEVYDNPSNFRFCGFTWTAASCKLAAWCPRGSDEECPPGQFCFSETTCNVMDLGDFTLPPTDRPTDNPTKALTWSPTDSPVKYNDPIHTSFCGGTYTSAVENCSAESHCPSGMHADCPTDEYCWIVVGCNILDIIGPTPPPTRRPSVSPTLRYKPSGAPSYPPTEDPTVVPTRSPLEDGDERRSFYCGKSWSDANIKCNEPCPSMTGCPSGQSCFSDTACGKSVETPEPTPPPTAQPTPRPTARPTHTPTDTMVALAMPRPTELAQLAVTSYPVPYPMIHPTMDPTTRPIPSPTARPTPFPTPRPIEATAIGATTDNLPLATHHSSSRPTPLSTRAGVQLAYFPYSEASLPKPSTTNTARIQHIVESIRSSLEKEIFVIKMRSGALVPSSLYTYDGFLQSLIYYTNSGVNGKFFYLGGQEARKLNKSTTRSYSQEEVQSHNFDVEVGIANLALFLAKMMGTITFERCDPNNISCGISALEDTFQERSLRVDCSPRSSEAGLECPNESGCNCILGVLNHFVGAQSSSSHELGGGKYSTVDFCETSNLLRSICSRRIDQGEELRWIAAFFHWVFFVQPYGEGKRDGWNYIDGLHEFVREGMVDMNFVRTVAGLSVLDAGTANDSNQNFASNFFQVMIKLSEGMSQPMHQPQTTPQPPSTPQTTTAPPAFLSISRQTARPTPLTTPIQKLAPTQSTFSSAPPSDAVDLISFFIPSTGTPTTNPPGTLGKDYDEKEVTDGNGFLSTTTTNKNSQTSFSSYATIHTPISYPSSASLLGASSSSPTPRRHQGYFSDLWYNNYEKSEGTRINNLFVWRRIIAATITYIFIFWIR